MEIFTVKGSVTSDVIRVSLHSLKRQKNNNNNANTFATTEKLQQPECVKAQNNATIYILSHNLKVHFNICHLLSTH